MFEYFHEMLRFGSFYRKNGIKSSDFRDLLLEGAIFIVETKNLPKVIFVIFQNLNVILWTIHDSQLNSSG